MASSPPRTQLDTGPGDGWTRHLSLGWRGDSGGHGARESSGQQISTYIPWGCQPRQQMSNLCNPPVASAASRRGPIYELGLDTAFDTAVCLLEWPNRLGEMLPKNALTLNFDITEEDFREISLCWKDVMWDTIVKNALKVFNNEKS